MTFLATSDQRRAAVLQQDRRWRRSDDPGQRTGPKWGGARPGGSVAVTGAVLLVLAVFGAVLFPVLPYLRPVLVHAQTALQFLGAAGLAVASLGEQWLQESDHARGQTSRAIPGDCHPPHFRRCADRVVGPPPRPVLL